MTATVPSPFYLVKQLELSVRARLTEFVRPVGITAMRVTHDLDPAHLRTALTTAWQALRLPAEQPG